MSKNLICELFQAIDSHNLKALSHIFHHDVVYERPGYEKFVGVNRLLYFYQHERILASGKHDIECIIVEGDRGFCCGRFIGVKKDNSEADEKFADVYSFKDGMIKTRRSYFSRPAV
jgi:ketosteroid isomerase-like protein